MAKASTNTTSTVLRHGPIERLGDNIWRVKGAVPGMSLERVITIVRRAEGSPLLHGPIAFGAAKPGPATP